MKLQEKIVSVEFEDKDIQAIGLFMQKVFIRDFTLWYGEQGDWESPTVDKYLRTSIHYRDGYAALAKLLQITGAGALIDNLKLELELLEARLRKHDWAEQVYAEQKRKKKEKEGKEE